MATNDTKTDQVSWQEKIELEEYWEIVEDFLDREMMQVHDRKKIGDEEHRLIEAISLVWSLLKKEREEAKA